MDLTSFLMGRSTAEGGGSGATYTAGANIAISSDNVISATDEKVKQSAVQPGQYGAIYPVLLGTMNGGTHEAQYDHNSATEQGLYYTKSQYQDGQLHIPSFTANYGMFNNETTFLETPKVLVSQEGEEDEYSPVVTENSVESVVKKNVPVITCTYYQESYGGEDSTVAFMNDSAGIIDGLIEQGHTSREIFNMIAEGIFDQDPILVQFVAQIMIMESETEGTAYLLKSSLTSCGQSIISGGEPEHNFTFLSNDFFYPPANAWQYVTIDPADGETDSGIPIAVTFENSADKYQNA